MIAVCGQCGTAVILNQDKQYIHADSGDAVAHILKFGTTVSAEACEECPECGSPVPVKTGNPFCSDECEERHDLDAMRVKFVCEDTCEAAAIGRVCTCPKPTDNQIISGFSKFLAEFAETQIAARDSERDK